MLVAEIGCTQITCLQFHPILDFRSQINFSLLSIATFSVWPRSDRTRENRCGLFDDIKCNTWQFFRVTVYCVIYLNEMADCIVAIDWDIIDSPFSKVTPFEKFKVFFFSCFLFKWFLESIQVGLYNLGSIQLKQNTLNDYGTFIQKLKEYLWKYFLTSFRTVDDVKSWGARLWPFKTILKKIEPAPVGSGKNK